MSRLDEITSEQFARWERRGRGWQVWPDPVAPEPPFRPFPGYSGSPPNLEVDDGRVPGLFASIFDRFEKALNPKRPAPVPEPEDEDPEPELLRREPLVELQTALPANLDIKHDAFATFLEQLAVCSEPVAFELVGTPERIVAQFAAHRRDTPVLRRQVSAYFPEVVFLPEEGTLTAAWESAGDETAIVEFGLEQEFMLPLLAAGKLDPFIGLIGAMSDLAEGEFALFQVLFRQTANDWTPSVWRAVTGSDGKAVFVNRPDLAIQAKAKVASTLYGVVVRIATRSEDFERAWGIARELSFALRVFANAQGNNLVPLRNDDYAYYAHCEDVLRRQSHRSGMLLNADELIGFVHFPSPAVRSAKLRRQVERTKAAPAAATGGHSLVLGENRHLGRTVPISLSSDQRTRHMHVIGATSTGKSTLLFNLIRQDIENGEGVAVIEPHGDLIERILGVIPPERINDVILIDPADEQFSVGFNILSAHSDLEKTLLASDLVSVFQRLSTSWGDQMGSVLNNAILAFLESSEGGTLADLRRFLIEPAFRERFLRTVRDPDIVYYWRKGFTQLSGNKSIGPVLTRLETFLSPKPIRYMVSQPVNRIDFADILDSGKILLAKLSQGQMGKENSFLLGSLLMAKFQQAAMSRQRQAAASRRDFWLYVDEFHNFITPSMAEILSGARKYRLGLVLAHQELRQLERDREVASAVLSNPYTRVVFRVGDDDARKLENGFSYFEARDFQNLETGRAVCRVEKADGDFNLSIPAPEDPEDAEATRHLVIETSRRTYATPRSEIEAALRAKLDAEEPESPRPASVPKAAEPPPVPKMAEVPKPTGSEKESPSVDPPAAPTPTTSANLGAAASEAAAAASQDSSETEHSAIKREITTQAEALGYAVTAEEFVPGTQGRADLVLRRGKRVIACEVSVTTDADDEIGNLTKCLAGGYPQIVLIATSARKLANIERRFKKTAAPDSLKRVAFSLPVDFVKQLRVWAESDPRDLRAESTTPQKQPINLGSSTLTEAERLKREQEMLERIRKAMKEPPTD